MLEPGYCFPTEFRQIPFSRSEYHINRGELYLAQRSAAHLLRLSRQRNDASGLVLGHYASGRNLMFAARFATSRSHLEDAVALHHPSLHRELIHQSGFHLRVSSESHLGVLLLCPGYPDQALAQISAAIAEARRSGHPPSLAGARGLLAPVYGWFTKGFDTRDLKEANALLKGARRLACHFLVPLVGGNNLVVCRCHPCLRA